MPDHPLAGHFSVEASAARVRHYRYVEERMMRIMGGWIALTPELPAKLLLGRHVWDCAQHADLWGRRLPELRAPAQQSEPANAGVVRFMDALEGREGHHETVERLAGMYRVLKPHLLAVYERHLGLRQSRLRAAHPAHPGALSRGRATARGGRADRPGGPDPGSAQRRRRAETWEEGLTALLREAQGVTGDAAVARAPRTEHPRALDDVVALGSHFAAPELPADLRERDRPAPPGRRGTATSTRPPTRPLPVSGSTCGPSTPGSGRPLTDSEIVGVARIGAHRMVKLAFRGPGGLVVVQQQWRPGPDGWNLHGADVVRVEPTS